jgi:hypothetical protein
VDADQESTGREPAVRVRISVASLDNEEAANWGSQHRSGRESFDAHNFAFDLAVRARPATGVDQDSDRSFHACGKVVIGRAALSSKLN